MKLQTKKFIYGAITIAVFVIVALVANTYRNKPASVQQSALTQENSVQSNNQNTGLPQLNPVPDLPTSTAKQALPNEPVFSSGESEAMAPDIQVWEVNFDGGKFSPQNLNVKLNDYVFFTNKSSANMWVASNPHPTHTDYPAFDSKQNIAPGGKFKFQFTKVGSWGYHDHLNPSIGGTVTVSK